MLMIIMIRTQNKRAGQTNSTMTKEQATRRRRIIVISRYMHGTEACCLLLHTITATADVLDTFAHMHTPL